MCIQICRIHMRGVKSSSGINKIKNRERCCAFARCAPALTGSSRQVSRLQMPDSCSDIGRRTLGENDNFAVPGINHKSVRSGCCWCCRRCPSWLNIISRPNTPPQLIPPFLCRALPQPLLYAAQANILDLVPLQSWQASSLSPRSTPSRHFIRVTRPKTISGSTFYDPVAGSSAKNHGWGLD